MIHSYYTFIYTAFDSKVHMYEFTNKLLDSQKVYWNRRKSSYMEMHLSELLFHGQMVIVWIIHEYLYGRRSGLWQIYIYWTHSHFLPDLIHFLFLTFLIPIHAHQSENNIFYSYLLICNWATQCSWNWLTICNWFPMIMHNYIKFHQRIVSRNTLDFTCNNEFITNIFIEHVHYNVYIFF